jgi:hypothetical protein
MQAGINDLVAASLSPDKETLIIGNLMRNYQYFLKKSKEAKIAVIMTTVVRPASPPLQRRVVWSDKIFTLVQRVNTYIRKLCADRGVYLIDMDSLLLSGGIKSDALPDEYSIDTLHFTPSVYVLMNSKLSKILK